VGTFFGQAAARLFSAVVILLIGWLVAVVVAAVVRRILHRLHLDQRVAKATGSKATGSKDASSQATGAGTGEAAGEATAPAAGTVEGTGEAKPAGLPLEHWISTAVFWMIILMAVMGALQAMGLDSIVQPINSFIDQIIAFLPKVLYAAILGLIAHLVGSVARRLVTGVARSSRLDERLATGSAEERSIASPLGDAAYYLTWLFFIPGILEVLGLESMLIPVQNMINEFLAFLPYLAAAAGILVVGWFFARIVQRVVEGFLSSAGVDGVAERLGLAKYMGGQTISGLLGLVVFVLILIPVVTAALDALNLESLTAPLTAMMNDVLTAVPSYIAAVLILVITYIVARWLLGIAVDILSGMGVNNVPTVLGLSKSESIGGRTLAQWIGDLALLIIMLLAAVQAAQIIGWTAVTLAVGRLGTQIVQIVIGFVIIAIGIYLGNMAARFVEGSTVPNKALLSMAARLAIIAFAGAMGLTTMGLAEPIVVLAFGLTFGAIAVAVALAFGLGGRDAAASQIATWQDRLESGEDVIPPSSSPPPPSPYNPPYNP
jgi:hypothetical protein